MEQTRFTRDMERAIEDGHDIEGLVSEKMKYDYRRETELGENLKEQMKNETNYKSTALNSIISPIIKLGFAF